MPDAREHYSEGDAREDVSVVALSWLIGPSETTECWKGGAGSKDASSLTPGVSLLRCALSFATNVKFCFQKELMGSTKSHFLYRKNLNLPCRIAKGEDNRLLVQF